MNFLENYRLLSKNTFRIDVFAKYYYELNDTKSFYEMIKTEVYKNSEKLILGGGSNLLFTRDFNGLVIKNNLSGIEVISETDTQIKVKIGAGENWHKFVMWAVNRNLGGVENLSLIPGNVGATPMQNIGAYGVEIKDVFDSLTALHMDTGEEINFNKKDCEFGYRESVFKRKFKNNFIINSVSLTLEKFPKFNVSYGNISQELEAKGVKELSVKAISDAVINIRKSKLPAPEEIGNAGSFFKNPEVGKQQYEKILKDFPNVVAYPLENGNVKLAAGWLIENCGWKGLRDGDAGVHTKQALVLVNYGKATGKHIFELSTRIMQSVEEKFGVLLEREVNIY